VSERTLVLVKPDAVRRGLVGEVLTRFERKGLRIVAMDQRTVDGQLADRHYAEHVERDFYPPLREFITSGPLVAMVLEGDQAIAVVRAINGATDGRAAAAGTIRGDLSLSNRENLVHASDSPESATREIEIFFPGLQRHRHIDHASVVSCCWARQICPAWASLTTRA
jgi:nucleoside-diphosphate kinase